MIEHNLAQLKKLKSISLTPEEKGALRASVARGIQMARPVPSEAYWQLGVRHGLRIGLSAFLFMVFVGGSVSVVADNSLPGDALYRFKININEEIKGALLNTPSERLSWEKERVDRRLGEIKTLATTATLTKEKQEKAQQALDSHLAKISAELDTLSETQPSEALKVTAELQENLAEKKEALAKVVVEKTQEEKDQAFLAIDATIQKVSDEEVKIVSKEIEKLATDIDAVSVETTSLSDETPPAPPVTPLSP